VAVLAAAGTAQADITHTVARGHTLEAIAHRYHVTVKAIVAANHLRDPSRLRVGQKLIIPGVSPAAGDRHGGASHHSANYAARPRTPGVVHLKRLATNETANLRVGDRRGRISPATLKTAERMWRYPSGQMHVIDGRLLALLGIVSNHFGSRRIDIISGFRPYSPTQYTAHSNHNVGHAVDFRIEGVPNEVVRDFCRTLHNVGVGYYPNSVFVHLDARASSAYWVDYSHPGQPPKYDAPNPAIDEGASDVTDEVHAAAPSEPQSAGSKATATTPATTPENNHSAADSAHGSMQTPANTSKP
jgi:uncharacterized protein YcbK (DUF882 family)